MDACAHREVCVDECTTSPKRMKNNKQQQQRLTTLKTSQNYDQLQQNSEESDNEIVKTNKRCGEVYERVRYDDTYSLAEQKS